MRLPWGIIILLLTFVQKCAIIWEREDNACSFSPTTPMANAKGLKLVADDINHTIEQLHPWQMPRVWNQSLATTNRLQHTTTPMANAKGLKPERDSAASVQQSKRDPPLTMIRSRGDCCFPLKWHDLWNFLCYNEYKEKGRAERCRNCWKSSSIWQALFRKHWTEIIEQVLPCRTGFPRIFSRLSGRGML